MASIFPPTSIISLHLDSWAEKVKTESNGLITIRHYPANILIPAPEMCAGIRKGAADIGVSSIFGPEPQFLVGTYLTQLVRGVDGASGVKIFDDIWEKFPELMTDQWEGYKLLWMTPSLPTVIFTLDKPVRKMEDFRDLEIRVPTGIVADMIQLLGGTPVAMSSADMVVALDKGTVDGLATITAAIYDLQLGDKIGYCTVYAMGSGIHYVIMNKDSWNNLHPDLQKAIDNTLEWAKQNHIDSWAEVEGITLEYGKSKGMEIIYLSPEEYARWDTAIAPVYDEMVAELNAKGYPGTELVNFSLERAKFYAVE